MALYTLKTSNPAFSRDVWKGYSSTSNKMTLNGIIIKSFFCILLVSLTTFFIRDIHGKGLDIKWLFYGSFLAAFLLSVLTAFVHKLGSVVVPLFAVSLGIILGGVTIYSDNHFSELTMNALGISIFTFIIVLFLYKSQIVKVSNRLKSVTFIALFLIGTSYLINLLLKNFRIELAIVSNSSWEIIGFNILASLIAAFSLLLSLDFIERKKNHVPKYMEWVAAWGLVVTLVWFYIEGLILIKKFMTS